MTGILSRTITGCCHISKSENIFLKTEGEIKKENYINNLVTGHPPEIRTDCRQDELVCPDLAPICDQGHVCHLAGHWRLLVQHRVERLKNVVPMPLPPVGQHFRSFPSHGHAATEANCDKTSVTEMKVKWLSGECRYLNNGPILSSN